MSTEKKPLAFGFSKVKAKTTLVQSEAAVKSFGQDEIAKTASQFELITTIEGKKITSANGAGSNVEKQKPLVIPCVGNKLVFDLKAKAKDKEAAAATAATSEDASLASVAKEDLDAVRELLADSEKRKNASKEENDLVIKADENRNKSDAAKENEKEEPPVEEPDYGQVEIEKFGLAALRGMGWSEKEGIGLTNKRKTTFVEPELRPKGLGLGAGSSSAKKSRSNEEDESSSLRYVKGAYVLIESGKQQGECGQIMGFDDGLNRILIKLASTGDNVSVIQFATKLLTKDEYRRQTERKSSSSSSSHSHSHSHSSSSHSHSHSHSHSRR